MLETIIRKSCGSTVWRIRSSILATYCIGDFEARAGRRFQVDGELAGVGLREEGQAEERVDRQAGHEQRPSEGDGQAGTLQRAAHPALVEIEQAVELPR